MMLLRKLCRTGGPSSQNHSNSNSSHRERNNSNLNPSECSRGRYVATAAAAAASAVESPFHRVRLRTPPPPHNYSSRQGRAESDAALPLDVPQLYAEPDEPAVGLPAVRPCRREVANERHEEDARSRSARSEAAATRRRQQQQRRQRLRFEERASTDSSSSSDSSDSICSADGRRIIYQHRRRYERAAVLRDAYCPDLLNACSLILQNQRAHRDPTSSPTASENSSDYIEIDDIRPAASDNQQRPPDHASLQSRPVHPARSTPELGLQSGQDTHAQPYFSHLRWRRQQQQQQQQQQQETINGNNDDHKDGGGDRVAPLNNQRQPAREMGQNLSLRRPRISLTWVLREQQQQQQTTQEKQQQTEQVTDHETPGNGVPTDLTAYNNNGGGGGYITGMDCKSHEPQTAAAKCATVLTTSSTKRRHKTQHPPGVPTESLNGYATTPHVHPCTGAPQKFFSNQNLLEYSEKRDPSKDLLSVCTPHRLSSKGGGDMSDALALAKRRNEIKKKFAARMATLQANNRTADGAESVTLHSHSHPAQAHALQRDAAATRSLKGTYSEPSLMAASEGNHRRHRHRKRRERSRVPKFGYEIRNVDEFLTKCSLAAPGNIPVVLSTSSILYQTRPGGYQVEIPLPLGMVVNAVFKNQNWLYVQTPHAEEGYVGYACCLPLGILPPAANGNGAGSKPTPCWESNGDVFPHPCGNMTDSEKEIRLRGGTRSDGARTPRGKRTPENATDAAAASASCGEQRVDKLYLRAASQPKLAEKAFAQLRSTKMMAAQAAVTADAAAATTTNANDEYVVLQQQNKSKLHVQKHMEQQQQQQQLLLKQQQQQHFVKAPPITNGHNGQHLHPNNLSGNGVRLPRSSSFNARHAALHAARHFAQHSALRQTLVAINADYKAEGISVQKGEIVTLCECRVAKNQRQWFYIKTRDGREGYIPAEVAGHGYL